MNPNTVKILSIGSKFTIKNIDGYQDVSKNTVYIVRGVYYGNNDTYKFYDDVNDINTVKFADVMPYDENINKIGKAIDDEIDILNKEIESITAELRAKIEVLKTARKILVKE